MNYSWTLDDAVETEIRPPPPSPLPLVLAPLAIPSALTEHTVRSDFKFSFLGKDSLLPFLSYRFTLVSLMRFCRLEEFILSSTHPCYNRYHTFLFLLFFF